MSSDQLTDYQCLLIDQFNSITSNNSLSRDQVILLLASTDWILEVAIINYYQSNPESQRDFITNYTESVEMSNNSGSIMSRIFHAFSSASSPLLPGSFPGNENSPSKLHQFFNKMVYYGLVTIQFVLILPLIIAFKVVGVTVALFMEKFIPVFNKVFGLKLSSSTYYARKNLTNPTERSRRFISEFDELINNKPLLDIIPSQGPEDGIKASDSSLMEISRPNFLECSYTNALYLLKKEFRWLLLYLQSDEHEDTLPFIQQVLLNDQFLAFLKHNDILVWGGNLKESESYQVANNFAVTGFPFLGLIALTSEETTTTAQVSLVSKVQGLSHNLLKVNGSINTPKIINKFHKTFERLNPNLVSLREEAHQRETSRNIRAQQDLAYQRSLAQDRRREEERQRELALQREEERRVHDAEILRLRKLKWLRYKYNEILQKELLLDLSDKKETSRIAIRLINGQRAQHIFHKSFTLNDIYIYADCLANNIQDNNDSGDALEEPLSYEHEFNFKLISVMPRAELANDNQPIDDCDLVYPSGNLVMEEV